MELTTIQTKINGTSKESVAKIIFYTKLVEYGFDKHFTTQGFNILVNLYLVGGTSGRESMQSFLQDCYIKGLAKEGAANSVRNVFTIARELGIVKRKKSNDWKISEHFIKECKTEYLVHQSLITNYAVKK